MAASRASPSNGFARKATAPCSRALTRTRSFDLADFRIAAAPFEQKSFSILLDTHILGEQARAEVSLFAARLPLRSPSAVSLKVKLRTERSEGSTSSAPFSPLARGLTSCPTYRTARPRPQRFQATPLELDSLHARTVSHFSKRRTPHVRT
jgi:hypothetical protein